MDEPAHRHARGVASSWLIDLDGVLIDAGRVIEGAAEFLARLNSTTRPHMVLTNNSMFTPAELHARLKSMGLNVPPSLFWTSALATARFLDEQRPNGSVFALGEKSVHSALRDVGYRVDTTKPDYVVLGETWHYSFEEITTVIRLVDKGAHLVATNPEPTGPTPDGPHPGCGAVAALVERATGVRPYFVGKPNPVMITEALAALGARPSATVIVGDRMETDIVAGVEAGLQTILVLSGVTSSADLDRFPYRPTRVVGSVADLIDDL